MAKKTKKKRQNPPLSFVDKAVYVFGILLCLILALLICFFCYKIKNTVIFSDSSLVAYRTNAVVLWLLPFFLFIICCPSVFIIYLLEFRKPIFGNKKVRYGEYPWSKDCFPFFDPRRKNVYVNPSRKKFHREILLILCVFFLIVTSLVPLGLFGRDCLYEDNSICSYDIFNQKNDIVYTKEDYSHLTIDTSISRNTVAKGRFLIHLFSGKTVSVQITINTKDGNKFIFSYGDFAKNKALDEMLKLKDVFSPQDITVKGEELLDEAIRDMNLNEAQSQKLRILFNIE